MKIAVYLLCYVMSGSIWAGEFSTMVRSVKTELVADSYELNADIDFKLSPVARESLKKGIPLTWAVIIKVEQEVFFWDDTLQELEINYQIQNRALLNLYSVERLSTGEKEMFSTLTGALNFISKIRGLPIIDKQLIQPDQRYYVAIKVKFKHEMLPVPIRPFSYFDSQWALSSPWLLNGFP